MELLEEALVASIYRGEFRRASLVVENDSVSYVVCVEWEGWDEVGPVTAT